MTENSDESLITAHLQGDPEAFAAIVRRYSDVLLGYLMRMCHSKPEAEDCFQETFKRVHQKAHTFRGPRFKNWLFRIATNTALDGLRRRRRLRFVSLHTRSGRGSGNPVDCAEQVPTSDSDNPSQQAANTEQAALVRRAVDSLPARQKTTLILAYFEQLNYTEIAEVMGCSVGTVKTQMYRALRTLARKLPDSLGDTE